MTIGIPHARPEDRGRAPAAHAPGRTSSWTSPEARLLVVDDEPNIRELLSASLRYAGFEVATAADGSRPSPWPTRSAPTCSCST